MGSQGPGLGAHPDSGAAPGVPSRRAPSPQSEIAEDCIPATSPGRRVGSAPSMEEAMMVSCVCFQIVRSFMRTVPMPWPALEGLLKFLWQKAPKSSCKHGLKWSNTKSTLASSMQSRAAEEEAPSSSGAVEMTLVRISLKAASSSKSGHKAWEVRARALQKSSYVSLLAPWSQLCTTLWKMMSASARVMDCSGDEPCSPCACARACTAAAAVE
mmetsp:Transcript_6324/g.15591  ORF Transcript_6324/g.15591 Transcript_6324/m.15591 type:complete len:213 (-) Transcript_6324:656-1294(-)